MDKNLPIIYNGLGWIWILNLMYGHEDILKLPIEQPIGQLNGQPNEDLITSNNRIKSLYTKFLQKVKDIVFFQLLRSE